MAERSKTIPARAIIQTVFFVVVIPFFPLLISGDWGWWQAWVYAATSILGFIVSRILAARRHPDILAERAKMLQHEDAKSWDRVLAPLVGLGGGLIPLMAGLDARFDWGRGFFNLPLVLIGFGVILFGYFLASWALVENRFFSGMVRIQNERGHQVVSTGPYRWMRHPGYAGALLTYLMTPIFLDSFCSFGPVLLIGIVLIIRTAMEDKVLQAELPGYTEYAQQTHYRLIPGIW